MNNYGLLTGNIQAKKNNIEYVNATPKVNNTVSFTGIPIKPAAYSESTYTRAKELYTKYRESLGETSLKSIVEAVNNIESTTEFSRETILTAMQKLTQFANMRSIKTIPEVLEKNHITDIGNTYQTCSRAYTVSVGRLKYESAEKAVCDDLGLHNSLHYLIEKKGFGKLSFDEFSKAGIFLDETKLAQFEKFKEECPEEFKKYISSPNLKFFFISGWDTGISIIDRTKDLETETRKLLEYAKKENVSVDEAIDLPLIKRIKKLGLNPTVIKTDGCATETCVYKQMTPEKMTENEFLNLIDSNSQIRAQYDKPMELLHKDNCIKYLESDMKVYTPETLSQSVKNLHEKIIDYAAQREISPENILYVEGDKRKSYTLANYYYEKVNHIPHEQFTNINSLMDNEHDLTGKLLVFLDDCTITGASINDLYHYVRANGTKEIKNTPKLFSCICGTEVAEYKFYKHPDNDLIIQDYVNYQKTSKGNLTDSKLEESIGEVMFDGGDATCLVFPYMSPDNNTELGANIALLHNSMYRARTLDKCGKIRHMGIKNYSEDVNKIAKHYSQLIGYTPYTTTEPVIDILEESPKSFKDRLKDILSGFFK